MKYLHVGFERVAPSSDGPSHGAFGVYVGTTQTLNTCSVSEYLVKLPSTQGKADMTKSIERVAAQTRTTEDGRVEVRTIKVPGGKGKYNESNKLNAYGFADDSFDGALAIYNGTVSIHEEGRTAKEKGDAKFVDGRLAKYAEKEISEHVGGMYFLFGGSVVPGVRVNKGALTVVPQQSVEDTTLVYVRTPEAIVVDESGDKTGIADSTLKAWWRQLWHHALFGVDTWNAKSGSTKAKGSVEFKSTRGDKITTSFSDLFDTTTRHNLARLVSFTLNGIDQDGNDVAVEMKMDVESFEKALKANGGLSGLDIINARAKSAEQVKADKANDAAEKAAEKAAVKAAKARLKQDDANNVGTVSGERLASVVNG